MQIDLRKIILQIIVLIVRVLTTFCFITSFSVLIFYYLGKKVFLQMAYFLNMKNKIGTVCPPSIFWSKAIHDEYKLLKRINHFRSITFALIQASISVRRKSTII